MDALITEERSATEPIEKSNLPLFKLRDSAKVTSMTDAAALKNKIQFPVVSNNFTPLRLHKRNTIRNVPTGITAILTILVKILLLFVFMFFPLYVCCCLWKAAAHENEPYSLPGLLLLHCLNFFKAILTYKFFKCLVICCKQGIQHLLCISGSFHAAVHCKIGIKFFSACSYPVSLT